MNLSGIKAVPGGLLFSPLAEQFDAKISGFNLLAGLLLDSKFQHI